MLLQFSLKNFRLFKEKATLSLVASNYDKETREEENVYVNAKFNYRLLKSAIIYGANASGKSKLFEAIDFMKYFVINSSKEMQNGEQIEIEPFGLSNETEKDPTEFEVVFIIDNDLYRYGFEVTKNIIVAEWLYYKPKTKEIELFYRDGKDFETHERIFKKGAIVAKAGLVRDNALLISVAAQFNEQIAIKVIDWFKRIKLLSGLDESSYHGFTLNKTHVPAIKKKILNLLKAADIGIQDLKLKLLDADQLPKELSPEVRDEILREMKEENTAYIADVLTTHKKYDLNKLPVSEVDFSMNADESSGTRKFFALTGPILDVIENGYILIVDELDSKLHPNLVGKLVSLFNSKSLNKNNAQLIFNTQNTNLLDVNLFRRDQVWFTNKDRYGAANLYSLADFKSDDVKKNEDFEKNYIMGKYGGVPFLGFFDDLDSTLAKYENEK